MRVEVVDATSNRMYLTAFDDQAQVLLDCPAHRMVELERRRDQGDGTAVTEIEAIFKNATFKRWAVRLKSRLEDYEGKRSVKSVIADCSPLNFPLQATEMMKEIRQA